MEDQLNDCPSSLFRRDTCGRKGRVKQKWALEKNEGASEMSLKQRIKAEIERINSQLVGGLSSEQYSEGWRDAHSKFLTMLDEAVKQILEELQKLAWNHYAISEPEITGKRPFPRCDKYSEYALVLQTVWLTNVKDVLQAVLEGEKP